MEKEKMTMIKPGEEEEKLTLEEMLGLAKEVKNWKEDEHIQIPHISGSLGDLNFKMDRKVSTILTYYYIEMNYKGTIDFGKYEFKEKEENGKRIKQLYENGLRCAKENEQKAIEDALNYVRGLLEK